MTRAPAAQRLLRAHLEAGAPARERLVTAVVVGLTGLSLVAVVAIASTDRRVQIASGLSLFAPVLALEIALYVALRRGWFHAAVPWLNTALQSSLFALPCWWATRNEGAAFATGNPMLLGWVIVAMASALRARPWISTAAGLIAAGEYLIITFAVIGGELSAAQRGEVITSAALVAIAGGGAAMIARYLVGQAEAALRAVREQDLMSKYIVHERLGAGGMAEVFRATYSPEGGFEKIVAIKRVLPEAAATADAAMLVEMFREEARLCAQLAHPNVIQVLDAGRFDGRYVFAMEYVDGLPLSRVLAAAGALPTCAAVYVAAELAAALEYIHGRVDDAGAPLHLVHRDVNPPNVLVSLRGEVKLADFGIAHAIGRATIARDAVAGKPGYFAPEQATRGSIDGRTDLYALGITLYEMLVGAPMFRGRSPLEVADFRIVEAELASGTRGRELPGELVRVVVELLAARPDDRPARAGDVRARLVGLTGDAAPFPDGPTALAAAVRAARAGAAPRALADPTAATVPAKAVAQR